MPIVTNQLFFLVKLIHASRSSFDPSAPSTDRLAPVVASPPIVFQYPPVLDLKWHAHEPDVSVDDVRRADTLVQGL